MFQLQFQKIKEKINQSPLLSKVVELYLVILMAVFPLLLFRVVLSDLTLQGILFFFTTFLVTAIFMLQLQKGSIQLGGGIKNFDRLVFAAFLYSLLFMIVKILKNDIYYEPEIIVITLSFLYLFLSRAGTFHRRYLYYLTIPAIPISCGMLFYYLFDPSKRFFLELLLADKQSAASYSILIATVTVLLYITQKKKWEGIFAGCMAGVTFFILFLQQNLIADLIVGVLFLLLPLLFVPTALQVKRMMQMAFFYFFLWSNMALLTNYADWIKVSTSFDLMSSICLDLAMAIAGVLFFTHWEKLPEGYRLEQVIMVKFRKVCNFLLKAVCVVALSVPILGNRIQELPETMFGREGLIKFVQAVQASYQEMEGTLYAALKEYGLIGGIFICMLFALIVIWLKRNFDRKKETSTMLTTVTIMYLLQSLFIKPGMITTPCYFVFVIFAVYYRKESKEVGGKL